jgi:hypothetical protein
MSGTTTAPARDLGLLLKKHPDPIGTGCVHGGALV